MRNESDPALALLADHVESPSHAMRCGACVGLGVAYAGARREDVVELLSPLVANTEKANMVEVCLCVCMCLSPTEYDHVSRRCNTVI